MAEAAAREAALITFLACAANITLLGIGGAFWGLMIGLVAGLILNARRSPHPCPTACISRPAIRKQVRNSPVDLRRNKQGRLAPHRLSVVPIKDARHAQRQQGADRARYQIATDKHDTETGGKTKRDERRESCADQPCEV